MVVHTCNPSYSQGKGRRIVSSRLAPGKVMTLAQKQKAEDRVQVIECLPRMCGTLGSMPND
jgi:hypothetical protein